MKILLSGLMIALCLTLLGGCVIRVDNPPAPAAPEGEAAGDVGDTENIELDFGTDSDPVLPEDEVDWDLAAEDIPRTIQPAGEEDQVGGVRADFVIADDLFAAQIDEMAYYATEYLGKRFILVGYVMHNEGDVAESAEFAIIRDYQGPVQAYAEDGVVGHEYTDEIIPVGIDCHYEGVIPEGGVWVRAVGVLTEYEAQIDGQSYAALKLDVEQMETIPETEGGSRQVSA